VIVPLNCDCAKVLLTKSNYANVRKIESKEGKKEKNGRVIPPLKCDAAMTVILPWKSNTAMDM